MLIPFRLISTLLGILVLATPVVAVTLFFFAIAGSPGACGDETRPITTSDELASLFQDKWDALDATLDAGQPASVTFTESEVTSRADAWLSGQDAPIDDVLICFEDDTASASAKIDIPLVPGNIDVLVSGTLILTGEVVQIQIDEIEVGGLPSPLTDLVEDFIDDIFEDQTEELVLGHTYTLVFTEGEVTVSGLP